MRCTLLELDLSLTLLVGVLFTVFCSVLVLSTFTIFVLLGLLGVSTEEFGRSSDELAFECCMRSRLQTRWTRFEESLPLARRRIEDFVDDVVDSLCPLVSGFLEALGADVGAFTEFCGMLSSEEADDAKN